MAAEGPEEAARAGLEHLQAAAREAIKAARSLLDAAEELVEDPTAVQDVAATVAALAQAAAGRLRREQSGTAPTSGSTADDHDDPPTGVQRIRIS